ncbi:hypothetical protein [Thiolapillus sp.]|uniref:hypothetical protein n=1 Tax=Thiolapillus sp. TaxID=2017437 RepID=UPI003AF9D0CA
MGEEDKADKGRGGKTTSGNGQAWSSASPRGEEEEDGTSGLVIEVSDDLDKTDADFVLH